MTDIVLIPGLWLRPDVWAEVETELAGLGRRARAVDLPIAAEATLDAQVTAVLAAVDACSEPPLVVGHSAAASLAWLAADVRPVAGVVLIGGFPAADGELYAGFLPKIDGPIPFPGWAAFEGPDSADLDADARHSIVADMVQVPDGVAHGRVRLANAARYAVPITLVCPEFTPEDARAWIAGGDVPELAAATNLTMVDIDSGHWPMFTQPAALAALLAAAAS